MIEGLFVPYDLAVKLKEIGFDEGCFGRYRKDQFQTNTLCRLIDYNFHPVVVGDISAPLWQQAFDFLREKHNLHGDFRVNQFGYGYMYAIIDDKKAEAVVYLTGGVNHKMDFYKAREKCLEKLVEIIANKK